MSTIFTGMYSTRLFLFGVLRQSKRVSCSRFCEPVVSPIVNLCFGALAGGSIIFCGFGPFCLEPLRPFVKSFFSSLLFISPAIVVFSQTYKKIKRLVSISKLYYAAGSGILFLTPFTSQKTIFWLNAPSRNFRLSDQSWFESGQSNT